MALKGQRKCNHCKEYFTPNSRNRYHQRYCSKLGCQAASKRHSQRSWLGKPGNNYFKGPDNVRHVQQWRKAHPGYWRKRSNRSSTALQDVLAKKPDVNQRVKPVCAGDALQDVWLQNNPYFLGVISVLTGYTLQDDIANFCKNLFARGHHILNPDGEERKTSHEH